jgi:putative ABC transport system ATP-binding protein
MASVTIDNVKKIYQRGADEILVLNGLTLAVTDGEFVALMGPSGSGKTTLLNLVAGIDRPTSGRVLVGSTEVSALGDADLARWRSRNVGFIFQFYNLMPVLTSVQNVELPLLVARVNRGEARRRAHEALDMVGLADWGDHVPDELSGGQRQRVTIARALVNDPAIVWADEPTGDLDSENAAEITELMRRLNREHGLSFLIVTHDIGVGRKTDRIVRMVDGRVVDEEHLEVV